MKNDLEFRTYIFPIDCNDEPSQNTLLISANNCNNANLQPYVYDFFQLTELPTAVIPVHLYNDKVFGFGFQGNIPQSCYNAVDYLLTHYYCTDINAYVYDYA